MPARDSPRQLSKDVLGREHALAVACVFLDTEEVLGIDEVVSRSSAPRTTVFKELELLTTMEAVTRFHDQRNHYQRVPDHEYWPFARSLRKLAQQRSFGQLRPAPGEKRP